MSWPRALAYLIVAAVLATVYLATAPPPPPSPAAAVPRAPGPPPAGPAIDSVHLQAGGRSLRARRDEAQWVVLEPAGARVPSDLISALVSAVLETPAEPVTTDADRLADFGLDSPWARLTFGRPGAPPVTLSLGGSNPAETGVYGRLEGNPQIILLGFNVRYYIDLVLKQSSEP
jgi:hypothetical protein